MLETNTQPTRSEGAFSEANRDVLARYWHAVAFSSELGDEPLGVVLLDIPLVLYRIDGRPAAALDRCPHRGARLSDGWIDGSNLICPYHGLHFDREGRCTRVPAAPEARIPESLQLQSVACQEANKLIWICLSSEADAPPPEWAWLDDQAAQYYALPALDCRAAATRFCENFNDVVHFSWVHRGTFGLSDSTNFTPYEVDERENGLSHEIIYRQVDRLSFAGDDDSRTDARYRYDFTLPFANHMQIDFGPGRRQHIGAVASPVSATRSRVFFQFTRTYDMDQPIEEAIAFESAVFAEDAAVLESLSPTTSPLDPRQEAYVTGDRWTATYRKRLSEMGLSD